MNLGYSILLDYVFCAFLLTNHYWPTLLAAHFCCIKTKRIYSVIYSSVIEVTTQVLLMCEKQPALNLNIFHQVKITFFTFPCNNDQRIKKIVNKIELNSFF